MSGAARGPAQESKPKRESAYYNDWEYQSSGDDGEDQKNKPKITIRKKGDISTELTKQTEYDFTHELRYVGTEETGKNEKHLIYFHVAPDAHKSELYTNPLEAPEDGNTFKPKDEDQRAGYMTEMAQDIMNWYRRGVHNKEVRDKIGQPEFVLILSPWQTPAGRIHRRLTQELHTLHRIPLKPRNARADVLFVNCRGKATGSALGDFKAAKFSVVSPESAERMHKSHSAIDGWITWLEHKGHIKAETDYEGYDPPPLPAKDRPKDKAGDMLHPEREHGEPSGLKALGLRMKRSWQDLVHSKKPEDGPA